MKTASLKIILAALEAAMKYGPALVMAAITALNKDEITLEDIQSLRIEKEPEEF